MRIPIASGEGVAHGSSEEICPRAGREGRATLAQKRPSKGRSYLQRIGALEVKGFNNGGSVTSEPSKLARMED